MRGGERETAYYNLGYFRNWRRAYLPILILVRKGEHEYTENVYDSAANFEMMAKTVIQLFGESFHLDRKPGNSQVSTVERSANQKPRGVHQEQLKTPDPAWKSQLARGVNWVWRESHL